jgi:hypothetical protein
MFELAFTFYDATENDSILIITFRRDLLYSSYLSWSIFIFSIRMDFRVFVFSMRIFKTKKAGKIHTRRGSSINFL